jgi:hypothetical protein
VKSQLVVTFLIDLSLKKEAEFLSIKTEHLFSLFAFKYHYSQLQLHDLQINTCSILPMICAGHSLLQLCIVYKSKSCTLVVSWWREYEESAVS